MLTGYGKQRSGSSLQKGVSHIYTLRLDYSRIFYFIIFKVTLSPFNQITLERERENFLTKIDSFLIIQLNTSTDFVLGKDLL